MAAIVGGPEAIDSGVVEVAPGDSGPVELAPAKHSDPAAATKTDGNSDGDAPKPPPTLTCKGGAPCDSLKTWCEEHNGDYMPIPGEKGMCDNYESNEILDRGPSFAAGIPTQDPWDELSDQVSRLVFAIDAFLSEYEHFNWIVEPYQAAEDSEGDDGALPDQFTDPGLHEVAEMVNLNFQAVSAEYRLR